MIQKVTEAAARFRKKYTLALLLFAAGTYLAWHTGATLTEYSMFASLLLGIFGAADVAEKKLGK